MNIGLPGTGLGGLFYLATAMLMPVFEVYRTLQGRSSVRRWQGVLVQTALAGGIVGGLWATAWCLNLAYPSSTQIGFRLAVAKATRYLGVTPTLVTTLTLGTLLLIVEALHLVVRLTRPGYVRQGK